MKRRKACIAAPLGVFAIALLAANDPTQRASFLDVTKEAGIRGTVVDGTPQKKSILEVNGTGLCWLDYNNDGLEDLYIVNGSTIEDLKSGKPRRQRNYLYRNDGNGKFTDVTAKAGVAGQGWVKGCAAADTDNDGYTDLLVTNFGRNELFKNNGNGTFTEIALKAGVGGGNAWHTGAAFADYDNDGWVDLFVAGYVEFDVDATKNYQPLCNYRSLATFCGPRGFRGAPHALITTITTALSPRLRKARASPTKKLLRAGSPVPGSRRRWGAWTSWWRTMPASTTFTTTKATANSRMMRYRKASPAAAMERNRPTWVWRSATTTTMASPTYLSPPIPTITTRSTKTRGTCSTT